MSRQQLLWLFIWMFIFFLIFCLWNKLKNHTLPSATTPTQVEMPAKSFQKEMHFKLLKEGDDLRISGIVSSQDDKAQLIDAYGKVFDNIHTQNLVVDSHVAKSPLLNFFTDFADNFSKFDSGYVAYSNGALEIDGLAEHKIVQQTLQEQLSSLEAENNLSISNKLILHEMGKQAEKKEQETLNPKQDLQAALDTLMKDRRVQFLYARDILTTDSKSLVDAIITLLQKYPNMKIEIAGHTDSDGSRKNNLQLSQRRADSIKNYMIKKGISPKRLNALGFGENQPLIDNETLKHRQINRRVEFKVNGE